MKDKLQSKNATLRLLNGNTNTCLCNAEKCKKYYILLAFIIKDFCSYLQNYNCLSVNSQLT